MCVLLLHVCAGLGCCVSLFGTARRPLASTPVSLGPGSWKLDSPRASEPDPSLGTLSPQTPVRARRGPPQVRSEQQPEEAALEWEAHSLELGFFRSRWPSYTGNAPGDVARVSLEESLIWLQNMVRVQGEDRRN